MVTYKDLIETVAQRQLGILGKHNTLEIFRQAGLELDDDLSLVGDETGLADLDKLISLLNDRYGPVPVIGCKITVRKKARQGGLELPDLLK